MYISLSNTLDGLTLSDIKLTSNSSAFCLHLPSAATTDIHYAL